VPEWWDKLKARVTSDAARRDTDEKHMTDEDRQLFEGNFEGYQADQVSEERLGGFDPGELEE
jgi:hypothetical protein